MTATKREPKQTEIMPRWPANDRPRWETGTVSRAHRLLAAWMATSGTDATKLSRRLDCSWKKVVMICSAQSVPNVHHALMLRDVAGIPISAWEEK